MGHDNLTAEMPIDERVSDTYELSPVQEGMYFHSLGDAGTGVDVEQIVCTITGTFDERTFVGAFEQVVSRHDILRTRFAADPQGRPMQHVLESVDLPVERLDLTALKAELREAALEDALNRDRERGLVLSQAPVMRITIVRWAESEHRIVWTFHHALLDGRSFPVVLREVFAVYDALRSGERPSLPPVRPYREHIERLRSIDLPRAEEFWRRRLAGFTAATPLVIDADADRAGGVQGATELRLSAATTEELRAFAEQLDVTLNTLLQSAWAIVLSRYSGEEDVVFGVTRAGRHGLEGAASRVGLFINTLPIRVRLRPDETLDDVIGWVRASNVELREHEHTPLAQIQSWSDVERGQPLFETIVVYDNQSLGHALRDLHPRDANTEFSYRGQTNYPLTLIGYGDDELLLRLENDRRRVADGAAARMLGHVATVLTAMPSSRRRSPWELPMLTAAERTAIESVEVATLPRDRCLHDRFRDQARLADDRVAVSCDGQELTYGQLERRSNALASRLHELGVRPRDLVGLRMERSLELVVGILAILKAGAAYLPLDPAYPRERVEFMLADAGARVVATTTELADDFDGAAIQTILVDQETGEANQGPPVEVDPDDLAYVIYTSGSTGRPKGVRVSHYNVTRLFDATDAWFGFTKDDVWTLFHSYAFDFSVWELWGALLHGGRLVVVPYWTSRSPAEFRELVLRENVTVLNQTPSAFRQLVHADLEAGEPAPNALRFVIFGGEALELQSLRPWFDRYGDARPQLVNMYGITETTVHVTYRPLVAADIEAGAGSVIGVPIPDLEVLLLDAHENPVPVGVPGEMYVGGAGVTHGYLHRPELTAERFRPDPRPGRNGSILYRSGDLAKRLENGDLEYLGRIDEQVKIRGFRIELGEIEAVLSEQAEVNECVVVARATDTADKQLVAYLVGSTLSVDELRDRLREKLPEYMVPAHFVLLPTLPLTANGKVDRKALPAPETARTDLGKEYVAPRSPVEETMARIWSSVLGVDVVGVDDNFFELGGDSILSIQVVTQSRAAGLNISPRNLFQHPTIGALAKDVTPETPAARVDEGPASGSVPLTPIQRWFFEQDFETPGHWNQAFAFEVPDDIDVDILERALRLVVSQHDALRLRFGRIGDQWHQEYADAVPVTVTRADLAPVPEADRPDALTALAGPVQAGLDITDGPLVGALHAGYGQGLPGRLVLAIHHLAVDGVSWRLLIEDLETAYFSLKEGREVTFPPRTTSYRRWSEALAEHAADPSVLETLEWWSTVNPGGLTDLPVDTPGGDNLEATARTHTVRLGEVETRSLLQQLPAVFGTEINDALLTALAHALRRWTSRTSHVVELEGHGREDLFADVDVSRTVGWFTTIFPFRLEAASDDVTVTLAETKERLRNTPHRGLSYGLLRYLGDEETRATLRSQPQPDVIFNYLGQFDQVVAGSSLFDFAEESSGPWHDPHAPRRHALEILTLVRDGRLEARFVFSTALHDERTVAKVADAFIDALRELVARSGDSASRRFTPSDFPLAGLDSSGVARLTEAYPQLEDAYPLSPMQRLFYAMHEVQSGVGVEDWRFQIRGTLDPEALRGAWDHVVARHPILRTAFTEHGAGFPLQVVLKEAALPWHEADLRGKSPSDQEAVIQGFVEEERRRGFDLTSPPLLRLALLRMADDRWDLLWFTHHLYIDGWSWPIVFSDLRASYEALTSHGKPDLGPPVPYSRYIDWLSRRSTSDDEVFWRAELDGLEAPTPLDLGLPRSAEAGPESCAQALSEEETERIRAFARRERVTLSSVVQAAWSVLLWHYSDTTDVLFGAAFSGRPAELPGVDDLVGPCVNNVPVRARISPADTPAQLAVQLQARQADLIAHQYDALSDLQRWTAIPLRQRMFDSLVVFQNYVVDDSMAALGDARLDVLVAPDATNYPLTLVAVPRRELHIKLHAQPGAISPEQGRPMLDDLVRVLAAFVEDPTSTLEEIRGRLPMERRGRSASVAAQRQLRAAAYAAPVGEMEEVVAKIWCELFEVDRIGMDDNFFDLGGHSLLLVRAHERLVEEVRPDLPVAALFQFPTVRSLARHLSGAAPAAAGRGIQERAERQKDAVARMKSARARTRR